jgi:DNA helicase II / ATP-dependent DNA helicase PcrA
MAGGMVHTTVDDEAQWAVGIARRIQVNAPNQRVGVIARSAPRRRFVDEAFAASGLAWHRWDDGVLDTDTARIVKALLSRLKVEELGASLDPIDYLRMAAGIDGIQDPSGREALADALDWCHDLLHQGVSADDVRSRIRIGDESTLITSPGVHLLTGHAGKGQQFDWVVVVGAEDGAIPDFRATTLHALAEEARVLAVMISRARHGVVLMSAHSVPAANSGVAYPKQPSRFWNQLGTANPLGPDEVNAWLDAADWGAIAAR